MVLRPAHFPADWEEDRVSSWGEPTFTSEFSWGALPLVLIGENEGLVVNPVLAHLSCYQKYHILGV